MDTTSPKESWEMPPDLLEQVLIPYRDVCQYLEKVSMEYLPAGPGTDVSLVGEGKFSIVESCYIDSTGHFNAVEFQICANQLLYAMCAESVRRGLVEAVSSMNLADFFERQLPNMLITNVTAAFRKVLNPRRFRGRARIDRSYRIKDRAFWECTLDYWDDEGGLAEGSIVVTIGLGEKMPPKE